jgi:hypothetical protein
MGQCDSKQQRAWLTIRDVYIKYNLIIWYSHAVGMTNC